LKGKCGDDLQALIDAGYYADIPPTSTSSIWPLCRHISSKHPMYDPLKPNSHQCTDVTAVPGMNGGICGKILSMHKIREGTFSSSNYTPHAQKVHKKITKKKSLIRKAMGTAITSSSMMLPASKKNRSNNHSAISVDLWLKNSKKKEQGMLMKRSIVTFVVYSTCNPALRIIKCPHFRHMLYCHNPEGPILDDKQLNEWIELETSLMFTIIQVVMELNSIYYANIPYGQLMHDGGTLNNRHKYQSIALKYISPHSFGHIVGILVAAAQR